MNNNYYIGVGRRKEATARVYLKEGKGQVQVRTKHGKEKKLEEYFYMEPSLCEVIFKPLKIFNKEKDYDLIVRVKGSGFHSQAEAIKLGIARALLKVSPEYKPTLKSFSLLKTDPRKKEREHIEGENNENIEELAEKFKLKKLPLASFPNHFQLIYSLKISSEKASKNLEDCLLISLPSNIWEKLSWLKHTPYKGEVGGSSPPRKNAMKFCREFNEQTKAIESSKIVNVRVVIKEEGSYQFFLEGRVTSDLIKKIVGEEKETRKKEISKSEIKKIIQEKLAYLNTEDYEKAEKTRSRRYRKIKEQIPSGKIYSISEGIKFLQEHHEEKLKNIEVNFSLDWAKQKSKNVLKSKIIYPNPLPPRSNLVIIKENLTPQLIDSLQTKNNVELLTADELQARLLVHPNSEKQIKPLERTLGPRGVYPTKKNGLLTENILEETAKFYQGEREIKTDKGGNIHMVLGKIDFSSGALEENYQTFDGTETGTINGKTLGGVLGTNWESDFANYNTREEISEYENQLREKIFNVKADKEIKIKFTVKKAEETREQRQNYYDFISLKISTDFLMSTLVPHLDLMHGGSVQDAPFSKIDFIFNDEQADLETYEMLAESEGEELELSFNLSKIYFELYDMANVIQDKPKIVMGARNKKLEVFLTRPDAPEVITIQKISESPDQDDTPKLNDLTNLLDQALSPNSTEQDKITALKKSGEFLGFITPENQTKITQINQALANISTTKLSQVLSEKIAKELTTNNLTINDLPPKGKTIYQNIKNGSLTQSSKIQAEEQKLTKIIGETGAKKNLDHLETQIRAVLSSSDLEAKRRLQKLLRKFLKNQNTFYQTEKPRAQQLNQELKKSIRENDVKQNSGIPWGKVLPWAAVGIEKALPDYSLQLQQANALIFCQEDEYKPLNILARFNKEKRGLKRFHGGIYEQKLIDSSLLEK
ncbi:17334_t:CDS:2 [Funneliformis geosporum]|nr:17334_t:CDS:2 [Funneliformis geosporum]